MLTTLRVANTRYALAQEADVDAIKRAAVTAAQSGGGMVDFLAAGARPISLLVTPSTHLAFEQREPATEREGFEPMTARSYDFIDFDSY